MIFFAWIVVFAGFVHTQSLPPRSVNVALETVLEFDGKHTSRDVKAIDKLQRYLSRIKQILTNNEHSRRNLARGLTFSDFLRAALQTVAAYDDSDLLDVVAIVNNELRKYHYKGCRFHELVENQSMRRDMAERLVNLNDLTAQELRAKLTKAADALDADDMSEQKKKMLDYIDSVYVGDDIKSKMDVLLTQLDQFRRRSKRSNLNLSKVVNQGLRSIVFDYYTNLNVNARKELKDRLESTWHDFKKSDNKKDVVKKLPKAFSASYNSFEISNPHRDKSNPKQLLRGPIKKKAKRNSLHPEPRMKKDVKKVKRPKPERPEQKIPKPLLRKKTERYKKYKRKDTLHTLKPTSVAASESESEGDAAYHSGLATAKDSLELARTRFRSVWNRKKQKKSHDLRKRHYIITEEPVAVYFKKSQPWNRYRDESSGEGLHIQSFEEQKRTNVLRRSFSDYPRNDTTKSTAETKATTTVTEATTTETTIDPNYMRRMDKIEKVLDEIKTLVASRRKANEVEKEQTKIPETITAATTKTKQTDTTATTTQTTKTTTLFTESTTQKTTTTEESKIKAIVTEEFKSKPQITTPTTTSQSTKEDTKMTTKAEIKSTSTTPKKRTDTTITTQEITTKKPELVTTVKTTLDFSTLDFMPNDTRRRYNENEKSRSAREGKTRNRSDLDTDKSKPKRTKDSFKNVGNDKLKPIEERVHNDINRESRHNQLKERVPSDKGREGRQNQLKERVPTDIDRERRQNQLKERVPSDIDRERRQNQLKEHVPTDIDRKRRQNQLKERVPSDIDREHRINQLKERLPTDKDRKRRRYQLKERVPTDIDRERRQNQHKINDRTKLSMENDDEYPDVKRSNKHGMNDDLDDFVGGHMNFGKENEWPDMEGHLNNQFKDFSKENVRFIKNQKFADLKHLNNQPFKDFENENMKFGKESVFPGMEHHFKDLHKDFAKDKMGFGVDHILADIDPLHKNLLSNQFKGISEDKMHFGKDKLTDHDVERMYDTHRALNKKPKDDGEITDHDIEKMYNETRRAHLEHINAKIPEGDRELHKQVEEKLAGQMRNLMDLKRKEARATKKYFDLDDPFDFKEEEFAHI